VIASARGVAPPTAVEFGRKMIFTDERPSFSEVDKALQSLGGG
jgi:chemotaxis protein MotA